LNNLRQTRGSRKTERLSSGLSKSASFLPAATSPASTQGVTVGAIPPQVPLQPTPKLPLGTSNPGTLAKAASTGALTTGTRTQKPKRPPPYGLSLTGGNPFVDESARSGVKLQAKYPVPLPPKLKPLDHWDLMVAFDSHKYRNEERELDQRGHYQMQMNFKKVLDDQMAEIQEQRDNEARGKEEERDLMTAQIEENKKYLQEEQDIIHRKREEQSKINTVMLDTINGYKAKDAERKQRECEEMTMWLAKEKAQREEDARQQAIEYARKIELTKKYLDEHRALQLEKKRQEEENELRLMRLRDQIADEQEAKKQKALQDRKDHIDRVEKTMGAAVAERDAKDAADLEAKIKRIQEEANRAAMEDAKNRHDTHMAKVNDMVATRKRQVEEKGRDDEAERQADRDRAAVYQAEYQDDLRRDKEKAEARRKAREDQDQELIRQMRIRAGIHEEHIKMTPRNRKTELGYNKAIFEQMEKEGFMPDAVKLVTMNPNQRLHHPEGKLTAFPTIPRYTGEIHPIELEQPDV